MQLYHFDDYEYEKIERIQVIRQKKHGDDMEPTRIMLYKDVVCAFDIETTNYHEESVGIIYHWQFCIFPDVIVGREWHEFREFMMRLKSHLKQDETLVCYIQNAGFEFEFLRGVLNIREESVFAVQPRKVLKFEAENCFEFRCSWLLTNMGLETFCKAENVEHKKGKMNYDVYRFPWTSLTDDEISYCVNDVLGLCEAIRHKMRGDDDNIGTIPLTATGYPRRDVRNIMSKPDNKWVFRRQENSLTLESMHMLIKAFRGGNTHANRFVIGDTIEHVHSYDRSSSYPDCIVNYPFPVGSWQQVRVLDESGIRQQINVGKAVLMDADIWYIKLKDPFNPCPYLAYGNCTEFEMSDLVNDNGRILSCSHVRLCMTDIDFKILDAQYEWKRLDVNSAFRCNYAMLPDDLRNYVATLYRNKTGLKGIPESDPDYYFKTTLYNKSKSKINSVYGMCVQNPLKHPLLYSAVIEGLFDEISKINENARQLFKPDDVLLSDHKQNGFICYSWGVWTSARARELLQYGIDKITSTPGAMWLYADTDSVKFTGEVDFSEFNRECMKRSTESNMTEKDKDGKQHYGGIFEDEGVYERFKTFGAKRYAVEENGKLKITVAGVDKKAGADEIKDLDHFTEDTIFTVGAGLDVVYNDHYDRVLHIDGHDIHVGPNIYLKPSTYRMGLADKYREMIDTSKEALKEETIDQQKERLAAAYFAKFLQTNMLDK